MGLKDFYRGLEDKYYGLMDALDKKGIPVFKLIDVFESRNIPSFPLFILMWVLIAMGIYFLFFGFGLPGFNASYLIKVVDESADPVSGAKVTLYVEGKMKESGATNAEGTIKFEAEAGKQAKATVSATGYSEKTVTLSETETLVELKAVGLKTIVFRVYKGNTQTLYTGYIAAEFSCSQNEGFFERLSTTNGQMTLEDVPEDCGKITAKPAGFECEGTCSYGLEDSNPAIYLKEEIREEKGSIDFYVVDENDSPLEGITVNLRKRGGSISVGFCETDYSGGCFIEGISQGTYWVFAYNAKDYASFNSEKEGQEYVEIVVGNLYQHFPKIMLGAGVNGEITVRVLDAETGKAIERAEVIFESGDGIFTERYTNSLGSVEFPVADDKEFNASIDAIGYYKETLAGLKVYDEVTVELTPVPEGVKQAIEAKVVDEEGEAVENVKVMLKTADEFALVGEVLTTGFDGTARFEGVQPGAYIVYAEKPGFQGNNKEVSLREREVKQVTLQLSIGRGTVRVNVKNESGTALQGVTVKVFDASTDEELSNLRGVTDSTGKKEITSIRADKTVYLLVGGDEYVTYRTLPFKAVDDAVMEKEIILSGAVERFEAVWKGLWLGNLQAEDFLDAGGKYTAKLELRVPKGSGFNEAGVHLRTGKSADNTNNIIEKDSLHIKSATASDAVILKGTSYNPPKGHAVDSQHTTSGSAKWANIKWMDVDEGIMEIEAEIQVRDAARSGEKLEIHYRAWGERESVLRFPSDSVLGASKENSEKQALYARVKTEVYTLGPSNLCGKSFCSSFTMANIETGSETTVVESYPAEISGNYRLKFSLTSVGEEYSPDAKLEIKSENEGLKFGEYEVIDVTSAKSAGNADRFELTAPMGNISKGDTVQGWVNFKTMKEGTNNLNFQIVASGAGGENRVFSKNFRVKVEAVKEMELEMLPLMVVPFIKNNVILRFTDSGGKGIPGVRVDIKVNGEMAYSGVSDSEGVYTLTLERLEPGAELTIKAEKNGYKTVEQTVKLEPNVLSFTPEEITESLSVVEDFEVQRDVVVRSLTDLPLTIEAIEFSGDFTDYLRFRLLEQYVGAEIVKGLDYSIAFGLSLSPKGKALNEVRTVKGKILAYLANQETEKSFSIEVPIEVFIGLGGEVDDLECLVLTKEKWNILTGKETVGQSIVLINNCSVDGKSIALKNLQAKVLWNENPVGEFSVDADIQGSRRVDLTSKFRGLSESLPTNSETSLAFTFDPDVLKSAKGTARLIVQATNPTEQGLQEIKAEIEAEVSINDILECMEIRAIGSQRLEFGPYNLGYGMHQNYFGYNPLSTGAYYQNPNSYNNFYRLSNMDNPDWYSSSYYANTSIGSAGRSSDILYNNWNQLSFPYGGYQQPFYGGGYMDPAYSGLHGYGMANQGKFKAINNCGATVDIEVDSENLMVSPDSGTLEPKEETEFTVQPAYFFGEYPVHIRAGLAASEETKKDIDTLLYLVQSEYIRDYSDCITLNRRTFQFNSLFPKPQQGIITNTCFNQGVILKRDRPIKVEGLSFFESNLSDRGYREGAGVSAAGRTPTTIQEYLIADNVIIDEPPRTKIGPNGQATEEMVFSLIKVQDPTQYQKSVEKSIKDNVDPIGKLLRFRWELSDLYYRAWTPSMLKVYFTNRYGFEDYVPFRITVEDLWELASGLSGRVYYGNPDVSPEECIRNRFEFELGFTIDEYYFDGGTFKWKPSPPVLITERDAEKCGQQDRLRIWGQKAFEKDNIRVSFEEVDGGKNIELMVKKLGKTKGDMVGFEGSLHVKVIRPNPARVADVIMPFKVNVKGDGEGPGEWEDKTQDCYERVLDEANKRLDEIEGKADEIMKKLKECELPEEEKEKVRETVEEELGGLTPEERQAKIELLKQELREKIAGCEKEGAETGSGVITKYGFDRLLFEWDYGDLETLGKNICDSSVNENAMFCDGAQYAVSLDQKAKTIKEFTEKVENNDCIEDEWSETKVCEKNSNNLYRFAAAQKAITDDDPEGGRTQLAFFLDGETGRILRQPKPLRPSELEGVLDTEFAEAVLATAGDMPEEADATVERASRLLSEMKSAPAVDHLDIVAEVNTKGFTGDEIKTLKDLGAEQITGKYYVLTFNEFKAMHDRLENAMEDDRAACADWRSTPTTTYPPSGCCDALKENATVCRIAIIVEDDGKIAKAIDTPIAAQFLQKLYKGTSFKLGTRNKDFGEKEEEMKNEIIKKGKKVSGITTDEIDRLYNENITVNSYLMHEAYTKSLFGDFASTYKNIGGLGAPDTTLNGKNVEKLPPKEINAGEYKVNVNYLWGKAEEDKRKFEITFERLNLLKDIEGMEEYVKNFLFEMPFDGKVDGRFSSTPASSILPVTIYDYGVFTDNADSGAPEVELMDGAPLKTGVGGVMHFRVEFPQSLEETKTGTLLRIEKYGGTGGSGLIKYTPSNPVNIKAELEGGEKGKGFYYEITDISGHKVGEELEPMVEWLSAEGQFEDRIRNMAELCAGATEERHSVVISTEKSTGTTGLLALAFVPMKGQLKFSVLCSQGRAEASIVDFFNKNPREITHPGGTQPKEAVLSNANLSGETIKAMIDRIKNELVCFEPLDVRDGYATGLELSWNKEKVSTELKALLAKLEASK